MTVHVLAIMRDELDAMKLFYEHCEKSNVQNLYICADNATLDDKCFIEEFAITNKIKHTYSNFKNGYMANNFYDATHYLFEVFGKNIKDEDTVYITAIDYIPSVGFLKEIEEGFCNIIKQHGDKYQGTPGFFVLPSWHANGSSWHYSGQEYMGAPFYKSQRTFSYNPVKVKEAIAAWEAGATMQVFPNMAVSRGFRTDNDVCPVIQSAKRWRDLGGYKGRGGSFDGKSNRSYDVEYTHRGLEDGGMIISLMGISAFHYDLRKVLHPMRGQK